MANKASVLLFFALSPLAADVRYQLRCEMESSEPMLTRMGALAEAGRNCSMEVLEAGNVQLMRNERLTQIFRPEEGYMIQLDHGDKTWRRVPLDELQRVSQASFEQLKSMGAQMNMNTRKLPGPKMVEGHLAQGIESDFSVRVAVPGLPRPMEMAMRMEVWVSDQAPGAQKKTSSGAAAQMQLMMQFLRSMPGGDRILREGALPVGQLMQTRMRMELPGGEGVSTIEVRMKAQDFVEGAIDPSEFAIPADYREVK